MVDISKLDNLIIMENLLLFIGGGSLVASVLIGLVKNFIKSFVEPRFGSIGIQITLFAIALLIGIGYYLWQNVLPVEIVKVAGGIFLGATAIYEVIYKAFFQEAVRGDLG